MNFPKPAAAAAFAAVVLAGGAGVATAADNGATEPVNNINTFQIEAEADLHAEAGQEEGAEVAQDGRQGRNRRGRTLSAAAEIIGLDAENIRAELQDGSTLADVAEANGVSTDDLIDGLVANVEERLDAKVEDGSITAEEAAEKLEAKTERIANKVNGIQNERGERNAEPGAGQDDDQVDNQTGDGGEA